MATVRKRIRKDGTVAFAVTWREGGKQTSRTFELESDARMLADFLSANNNSFTQAAAGAGDLVFQSPFGGILGNGFFIGGCGFRAWMKWRVS